MRRVHDLPRKGERRLARLDAAAIAAHVDLDMDGKVIPGLARRVVERANLRRIVGADTDAGVRASAARRRSFCLPTISLVTSTSLTPP